MDLTYNKKFLEEIKRKFVVESLTDSNFPDMSKYKHKYIVYLIINRKNGMRYVGSTTDFNQRINHYIYDIVNPINSPQKIVIAMRNEGIEDFMIVPIDMVHNRDELRAKEFEYIKLFRTTNPNYGYNMANPRGDPVVRRGVGHLHKPITKAGKAKFIAAVNPDAKDMYVSEGMKLFADITDSTKDLVKNEAKACIRHRGYYIIYLNYNDRTALYNKTFERWEELAGIMNDQRAGEKRGRNRANFNQYLEVSNMVTKMVEEETCVHFLEDGYTCHFLHYDLSGQKPYLIDNIGIFFENYDLTMFDDLSTM